MGEVALPGELGEVLLPLPDHPSLLGRPLDHAEEVLRRAGPDDEVEGTPARHLHGSLHRGTRGHDHDDRPSAETSDDLVGERRAFHAGHGQRDEGHLAWRLGQEAQGARAVRGGVHDAPALLQYPPQALAHALLGVDHQHADRLAIQAGERGNRGIDRKRMDGGNRFSHAAPSRKGTARSCPAGARGAPAW